MDVVEPSEKDADAPGTAAHAAKAWRTTSARSRVPAMFGPRVGFSRQVNRKRRTSPLFKRDPGRSQDLASDVAVQ